LPPHCTADCDLPVWSIVVTCVLAVLLTGYAALYSVVVAISTTALYLAYAFPIYLNLRNKLRRSGDYTTPDSAPWSLGAWGIPLNVIAVAWVAFYWTLVARRRFRGPQPSSEAELRRMENGAGIASVASPREYGAINVR
jgi:hypothetical protein